MTVFNIVHSVYLFLCYMDRHVRKINCLSLSLSLSVPLSLPVFSPSLSATCYLGLLLFNSKGERDMTDIALISQGFLTRLSLINNTASK